MKDVVVKEAIPLSPRESEVIFCLIEGKSNRGIAHECKMSEATVKAHLKSILRKTKKQNRTQVAVWAFLSGRFDKDAKEHLKQSMEKLDGKDAA